MNSGYAGGNESSANSGFYFGDTVSVSAETPVQNVPSPQKGKPVGDVEAAVFAYIQAIRALGKTDVNTTEISRALRIPLGDVQAVIKTLAKKGVKVAA